MKKQITQEEQMSAAVLDEILKLLDISEYEFQMTMESLMRSPEYMQMI